MEASGNFLYAKGNFSKFDHIYFAAASMHTELLRARMHR